MSRTRISRLLTSSLIAATMMTMVPVSFGATAQDIEHIRNSSADQLRREADQRAEERARQAREQLRQLEEHNRQQAKDLEALMQRHEQERIEADRKIRLEAREKELEQEQRSKADAAALEEPPVDAEQKAQ
jgi:hypothetical protein